MSRRLLTFVTALLTGTLVLIAVALSVARAWLPQISERREEVQRWVSEALGQPVEIAALDAEWRGLYPVLHLREVRLLEARSHRPLLRFAGLRVAVDPYVALFTQRVQVHSLSVIGAQLSLERHADGSLGLTGFEGLTDPATSAAVLGWLAAQPRLHLLQSGIQWRDARAGAAPLLFSDVDLSLENDDTRHRLAGTVQLPQRLGARMRVALDFNGDLADPLQWNGVFHVESQGLQLPAWLAGRVLHGVAIRQGLADAAAWGDVGAGQLRRLTGHLQLRNVRFAAQESTVLDELGGDFVWTRPAGGWRLDVEDLQLAQAGGRAWPGNGFSLRVNTAADGARQIDGGFDFVRLEDIAALALASGALSEERRTSLAQLAPRGELRELRLRATLKDDAVQGYSLRGRLDRVGMRAWNRLPAVAGVSGQLIATDRGGEWTIDSRNAEVELAQLFRQPLQLGELRGTVQWRRHGATWRVQSGELLARNADISTRTRFTLDVPPQDAAFLDLQAEFADGATTAVPRYLPANIMPEGAVAWLDRAFTGGRVRSGGALFHGRLTDFPFDRHEGIFSVNAAVEGASLDYQPGWPAIAGIAAQVNFTNRGMMIESRSGSIYGTALGPTRVSIADLVHAELQIDGTAQGSNADLLRFVRETPLSAHYGDYLAGLQAEGDSRLDLSLHLPLHAQVMTPRIRGNVAFTDATLRLPEWGLTLESLQGPLGFTSAGLTSEGLEARLFDQPVRITAHSRESGDEAGTTLELRGHAPVVTLARLHPAPFWRFLNGRGDYQAQLYFTARAGSPASLRVDSQLQGVGVKLPEPFGKAPLEKRPLHIVLPLSRASGAVLLVNYDDRLRGAFALPGVAEKAAPLRGELRLGGAPAQLPEGAGLRIAGELQDFSVATWREALADPAGGSLQWPEALSAFDIRVQTLDVDDRPFHAVQLQATRDSEYWQATVTSDELAGHLQIPLQYPDGPPVTMDLDRLRIDETPEEKDSPPTDPRTLPALRVNAKRFHYHGKDFGALQLATSRTPQGMRVDKVTVEGPDLKVHAQGDWAVAEQAQISNFSLDLQAPKLGALLAKFGYVGDIKDGRTKTQLQAEWPGSPARFALERVQGKLHVNIRDGRFVDIEPGAGRVFGLLSINELQRRLRLDFSDLFRKGFSFDEINGDFRLGEGNAFTDNLVIKGPSARLQVSGRTGLVQRDYDQRVIVTPTLGASLPLAGAIASPGIGAALFVAQKLFESQLDEMTRYQYTVQGGWDKPTVTRVPLQAPKKKQ